MSAAQRRCQTLLLRSIAQGIDGHLQSSVCTLSRLSGIDLSSPTLQIVQPIVSLLPQKSPLHDWSTRSHVYGSRVIVSWQANGQELFPQLVQHSLSQRAGAPGLVFLPGNQEIHIHTGICNGLQNDCFKICAGLATRAKADEKEIPKHAQQSRTAKTTVQAFHDAGWTREAVINVPNAISMARLISGPFVAYFILHEHWATALSLLAVAGASDWADGYAAKHYGQSSVLGSYLDPLADKVLVCCTVGALAQQGSLPMALAGIIIGRDVLLISGAFVDRVRKVGGKRVGWAEFFRLSPSAASADSANVQIGADSKLDVQKQDQQNFGSLTESPVPPVAPATFVQPLYISKVNTVFQLFLIAGCISRSWYGWPNEDMLWALGSVTALTTVGSFAAYLQVYRRGKHLTKCN